MKPLSDKAIAKLTEIKDNADRQEQEQEQELDNLIRQIEENKPVPINVDEGEQQMILLALAELALTRPGFEYAIGVIAEKLNGKEILESFMASNMDRVEAMEVMLDAQVIDWPYDWNC